MDEIELNVKKPKTNKSNFIILLPFRKRRKINEITAKPSITFVYSLINSTNYEC